MNKRILIPAGSMAGPEVSFLELWVEPDPEFGQDPYRFLGAVGLSGAAQTARLALRSLPPADMPACVQIAASGAPKVLTNSSGAALALTLAPLLFQSSFLYQRYLIMGGLDVASEHPAPAKIPVCAIQGLLPKLQAILSLGYRVEPVLLLLAQEDLDGEAEILLQGMASLNIAVRRVRHLEDAYRACAGLTLSSEEPHVSI